MLLVPWLLMLGLLGSPAPGGRNTEALRTAPEGAPTPSPTTVVRDTGFLLPPGGRAVLGVHQVDLPVQPPRYPLSGEVLRSLPPALRRPLQDNLNRLMLEWPRCQGLQMGPGDTLWLLREGAQRWQGYRWPDLAPAGAGPPARVLAWTRTPRGSWILVDTAGRLWLSRRRTLPTTGTPLHRIPSAHSVVATEAGLWVATRDSVYHRGRGLLGVHWKASAPGGWLLPPLQGTQPGLLDTLGHLRATPGGPVITRLPSGSSAAGWADLNQDGIPDLVFLYDHHPWYRRGLPDGGFQAPDTMVQVWFPFQRGFAPSLTFASRRLGFLATPEGRVYRLERRGTTWHLDSLPLLDLQEKLGLRGLLYPVIRSARLDDDTLPDFVVGLADGRVLAIASSADTPRLLGRVASFAAPVKIGKTWYAGDAHGHLIHLATGDTLPLVPPPDSGSVFPVWADFTGDGRPELVIGQQRGGVRVWRPAKDSLWHEVPAYSLATPEMAVPAVVFLNDDALPDLVVATLGGRVFAYETVRRDTGIRFVERHSWRFRPQRSARSLAAYLRHSYLDPAGWALQVQADTLWSYARLLEHTPRPLLDEVAFSLAHTPPEILRVLARLHQEDLFLENARGIYRADSALDYVTLLDLPDGRTTALYAEGDTLPPDLYGWYVVHPRILYEVPYRVDASYWHRSPEEYGVDRDSWLRHEEDVYAHPDRGVFWRTLFLRDSTYGRTPLDAVAPARTLQEAVQRLYRFQGWNTGGFMSFGYKTQDLQPVVIYRKAYGSCGEQSILFAALARTALIPTYVAIDMGEDHQWNEFWCCGRWHHLDVNWDTLKGIDHPATSVMKKTITAVVGWRPDDSLFVITGRYVDTASVDFQVTDPRGHPVPGALVVLRSHWNHRDMRAVWGYTDHRGLLHLPVGYQPPLGNAVEVLSPVGLTGVENALHQPGKRYHEHLEVPGTVPATPTHPDTHLVVESQGLLWVHNPITSRPYRITSTTLRTAGYEGTLFQPVEVGPWWPMVERRGPHTWQLWNPHPYLTLRVRARMALPVPPEPARIHLTLARQRLTTGEPVAFAVDLQAPAGLKTAELRLLRGDAVVRRMPLHEHGQPVERTPWRLLHARVQDTLATGAGGPLRPGTYRVVALLTDLAGQTATSETLSLILQPTGQFHRQWVYQDDPHAPEPSASWILEFQVQDTLRLLYAESRAPEARGLDLDLFLYRDQDQDGRPSRKETVASSTSPTSHEVLLLHFAPPGHYWLYAQGCTVEHPPQPFDLVLSFVVDSAGVARERPLRAR